MSSFSFEIDGKGFLTHPPIPAEGKPFLFLMQYTELKDKNGKEIYEGDIVLWSNENTIQKTRTFEVKYGEFGRGHDAYDYHFGFYCTPIKTTMIYGIASSFCSGAEAEVIGNIYNNQELLTW